MSAGSRQQLQAAELGWERGGLALAIGLPMASAVQKTGACDTLLVAASRAIGAAQHLTMQ